MRAAHAVQLQSDSVIYDLAAGSRLVVKTGKAGLFGFLGHTHVIRARGVSGVLVYRPGRPASSLRLEVPTDSLEVLTPPDTAEIRKVTEAMRTEVLDPDRHPTMTFAADSIRAVSGRIDLQLAVTMEGITRTIPVTAETDIGPDTVRAIGSFEARQTDFGITPYSGGPAGTVKVADRVTFCLDLIAIRTGAARGEDQPAPAAEARRVPGCVDDAVPRPKSPLLPT